MKFTVHDSITAPVESRETLAKIAARYGFIPNLAGVFAESPGALQGLLAALAVYDDPGLRLSAIERQVVLLAVSVANRCAYCSAAHGMLAQGAGLGEDQIARLQRGESLADSRLQVLREFAEALVEQRGWVAPETRDAFTAAGFTPAHALEVVYGVALKTLTNYANRLAQPPVNGQFARFLPQWAKAAA